jgi:hypothetical protein
MSLASTHGTVVDGYTQDFPVERMTRRRRLEEVMAMQRRARPR